MSIYQDQNKITSDGASLIIASNFPKLQYLYLGKNMINDEGVMFLSRSNWKSLYVLMLCNINPIQPIIR